MSGRVCFCGRIADKFQPAFRKIRLKFKRFANILPAGISIGLKIVYRKKLVITINNGKVKIGAINAIIILKIRCILKTRSI